MAAVNINLKADLQHAVRVQYLDGNLFSQDAAANTINIEVTDGGAPAEIGGTVSANVIRPDGGTVAVTGGTISGNIVSITLPAACYALVGMITIVVKLTDESTVTTLAAAVAYVYQSSTDTVVDPGTVVSSIQDLIDDIDTAVASIPADYSSLWTKLAPAFSSSTAYTAGQYVTYNSGLYRFTKAHAAGSWASGDVVAVNLGGELSDVKSAFDNNSDSFLVQETFETTPNRTSALNPLTGGNGSYVGFRTGYISYNKPLQITFNEDGYKFVVWTYSSNSTTNAVFAPVKNYVRGTLYLKPVTGSNPCFRIGVIKDSGEAFTEEEAVTTYAKIQYRSQTDKTLLLENVPADAKKVGDKVTSIESDINEINTELVENGKNIVNHHADESGTTSSGLNYSCENDVWTIEGENGDSIWFRTLAGGSDTFPFGLKAGDTVKLYASVLKDTNVYIAFRPYKNGASLTAYQYDTNREFTIPSDADAMQIRIEVPKNRTVSSAVTYKPEVRMTDTNKELEIRVNALENSEQADNSSNIIKPFDREETTTKGLTYSATNGVLTIRGTATDTWYTVVGGSGTGLPDGIEPGKTYFFWLDGPEGLRLSLYSFPGSDNIFETSSFGYFTIPADATAIQIRIRVPNGQVIPQGTIVYPYIGENIPNVSLKTMFGFRSEKPMLTIIDDDGNNKFYTKLLPIIIEKNVPITSATVCGYIDNPSDHSSMTWDQVVECYQKGAEIVSHTMTHVTGTAAETMTEREIERDYRMSRNVLASHGIPTNILVYAGNSGNLDKCVNAAKKTFDYAFHSDGGKVIKQSNFRPYYIQRYGIGIGSFVIPDGETVPTVPKGYIDACIENPGWIIWMIHTSSGDWTDAQVNGIKASIDYALENGVDIVSCEYALKQFVKT